MFQARTAGHHLKHSIVGDVVTASDLQATELRAALSQHMKPPVGEPFAAVHHHRLQGQTHVGGVLAQPVGQHPDGAVGMEKLPR